MGTYEPCVLGSDGNCTRWSHDHAADRPTTTAPRVGDTIMTAEQLDALPSLAIVIDANDEVQQRHGHLSTERGDYSAWLGVMPPTCKPSPEVALPVTVLYVPGEQTHPSVDALRAEEGIEAAIEAATEAVEAEFASMNAGSDHGARDVAEAAISAYGSALAPVTAADRPPDTDDARDEAAEATKATKAHLTDHYVDHNAEEIAWVLNIAADMWAEQEAADRAETTTDEACGDYPAPCNCDDPDTHDGATSAETTTATTEDAEMVIAEELARAEFGPPGGVPYRVAQALADAGLLATAGTRPTREQVTAAIGDAANATQIGFGVVSIAAAVDAVLALLADQPDPADVWDEAVEKIREQHPACEDPCEMCAEMDDWLTALADNPYRGGDE